VDILIRPIIESDVDTLMNNFAEQGWEKSRAILKSYYLGQVFNVPYVFIAEYKNQVAGYTTLLTNAIFGPFAEQNIPKLNDLIVFEKFQRKGIASAILDAAEQKASELSDKVHLAVGLHSGYGKAQRLYIKRGYVPDGSGIWYKDAVLNENADCINSDDLVLYLVKCLNNIK
jgi:GNAT superfamily N-acetyltransferase